MTNDGLVDELARRLAKFAALGIHEALGSGALLQLPGSPGRRISLGEVQAAADAFPDEAMRIRIQTRLGLSPYVKYGQRDRNELFADTFTPRRKYSLLKRADQQRPLRLLATHILADAATEPLNTETFDGGLTPYRMWDVIEYEVHQSLPDGKFGKAIQTHRRLIQSKVDGLNQFRIVQNTNWPSGGMPRYQMISGGECRTENLRATTIGGFAGFRFDLVINIDTLNKGAELDLRWLREYDFEPGDLGQVGDTGSLVVSPIVRVKRASMSVRFSKQLTPRSVWLISNVPEQDRTQVPASRRLLKLDNGVASAQFIDLPEGYASGIGWAW